MSGSPRRARDRALSHAGGLLGAALLAATLVLVPGAGAGAASCPATAVATVAQAGWAQERYDLAAVGRLSRGEGVTVAVLDSGVDQTHPQLAGAARDGGDELADGGTGLSDCVGHGTAVASLIAARPAPGIAFQGVAPSAQVLSIRVSERVATEEGVTGAGDLQALVDGIQAAVAARPRPGVLNLSLSTTTDSPALRAAVRAALDADIVVVASVGNLAGQGNPTPYPAAYDGVVGVGAIDAQGRRLAGSQVGGFVDLVAPGGEVVAAARGGGHVTVSGTSFAVPYVAGTAALIRARWPQLRRDEVVRRLLATADPPAGDQPSPDYGRGVVNPMRALTEVLPPVVMAGPTTITPAIEPVRLGDGERGAAPVGLLTAAGGLLLGALVVAGLALATPAGRRRGWRPGS
jgi:type VII secretion-associated serine protease mycosin